MIKLLPFTYRKTMKVCRIGSIAAKCVVTELDSGETYISEIPNFKENSL